MVLTSITVLLFSTFVTSISTNYTETPFIPCPKLNIANGNVTLEHSEVSFIEVVSITCQAAFDLQGADKIACVEGAWQPPRPFCVERCDPPPYITNGAVQIEGEKSSDGRFKKGGLATYTCSRGSELVPSESKYRVCEDGVWTGELGSCIRLSKEGCKPPEHLKNGYYVHEKTGLYGVGERLHYSCNTGYDIDGYSTQTCLDSGSWSPKIPPKCLSSPNVFKECPLPPDVIHGTYFNVNDARFDYGKPTHYFGNRKLSYQCYPGYEIRGPEILTCSGGRWEPREPPICISVEPSFIDSGSTSSQILASLASGVCVLLLLVVVCLVVLCKRRKPLSRAVPIQPTIPRPDLGDHVALLHPPDRLALIAFADGIQAAQPVLPTYEEAIRDSRAPGYSAARIQRPHWPSLATRRSRNSPNPDSMHVTRQGSFASHSASLRSDPMGSTDTMAVSENSTTVTLETVSSHSGSQPASCRGHCGSLASFDTSSVLNTEGVPLLEESELEDGHGDSISLAMENRSMTDNSSYKLSTHSDIP